MFRSSRFFVGLLSFAALAACNDNNGNFVHTTNFALVRFANASDVPITVIGNGVVDTINANLAFGAQSGCLIVDLTNTSPVVFTNTATGAVISFSPALFFGGNFTIIAFAGVNGVPQFTTLTNGFDPVAGDAGFRLFNAAFGSGTLFAIGNGATLTPTGATFGRSSGFSSVPAVATPITITNGTVPVVDAGSITFTAGQDTTMVVGPPSTGTTTLRFFTTNGC